MTTAALEPNHVPATAEVMRLRQQLANAERLATLTAKAMPGELLEVADSDITGRRIIRFYGDPNVTWAPFKATVRSVTGFNR